VKGNPMHFRSSLPDALRSLLERIKH
jgi:hypothetical protein